MRPSLLLDRFRSRSTPLWRVRQYTVVSLAFAVICLPVVAAVQLRGSQSAGAEFGLTLLMFALGGFGAVAVWASTNRRALPTWAIVAWTAFSEAAVYLATRATPTPTARVIDSAPHLLMAMIVVVLGAIKRVHWAFGATGVAYLTFWLGLGNLPKPGPFLLVACLVYLVGVSSAWLYKVVAELDASRLELAARRVEDERRRFSQDVHDVVGRALSTIVVKANLAAALVKRGDRRAEAEMLEVASVANAAISETRLLAMGYREVNLEQELAGAKQLLERLQVKVSVAGCPTQVPEPLREPMALVLREAVTNTIRHSNPRRVQITLSPRSLTVVNDGAGNAAALPTGGSGLKTLTQALESSGAIVQADKSGDRFTVQAAFEEASRD